MNFQVSMHCKKWGRSGDYNTALLFGSNLTPLIRAITLQLPRADLDPRAESQGRLKRIHLMRLFWLKLCSKRLYTRLNQTLSCKAKLALWGGKRSFYFTGKIRSMLAAGAPFLSILLRNRLE